MNGQAGVDIEQLRGKSPEELSAADWERLGIANPAAVKAGLAALRLRPEVQPILGRGGGEVLACLAKSCDPDKAFSGLQRWLEAGGGAATSEWHNAPFLELLCRLFAATPGLTEYLIRFPQRTQAVLGPLLQPPAAGGTVIERPRFSLPPEANSYAAQLACIRRLRIEHTLRIAGLDLLGSLPLPDTTRALSDLADACLALALAVAVERLRPRLGGVPETAGALPFVVLALGKLGGRELNYSSDIDLVFAYSGSGETAGASRRVDFQSYFKALGEDLIAALDSVTEDGRAYRVDMRLRPHGSAGPLVLPVEAMLEYFQSEGRTWERQAWLKARPVAGSLALGQSLLDSLSSFVFRRYFTLDAISDLQALKRQMELSVARRGESTDEVKLGRGGIRDIEFVVQFMQLSHGGENPRVRSGNTLRALYELRREGLLAQDEAEPLVTAYVFLRHVEHRLQLHGDLQVHLLPGGRAERRRLARSLGYADDAAGGATVPAEEAFENDRGKHTSRTREIFERLFANLFRENTGPEGELSDLLLAPQPDIPRLGELLRGFGFTDPPSSARELLALASPDVILTAPSRTRKFFASVAPALLKALAATGEPDEALRRFSRVAGSLGARAIFYQMLNENAWLLKMTVDLAAWSEYLTGILVANPGLFDELVDALQTATLKTMRGMLDELAQIARGGDIADTLRAYRAGELLRIGVRDLIHSAALEQTQSELSDLAEAILRTQLQHSVRLHRERRGSVKTQAAACATAGLSSSAEAGVGFAILAVGKFGGREMNYGSDLDVIFFYGDEGQTDSGLPAGAYFAELAQDLTRAMATPTGLGVLYELDARLRPNGNKGPLALSPDYFRQYCREGQLADWERLALTRARFVAGDEGVGERALHLIRSAVYSPLKDTQALAREARAMRQRLEETAAKGDLKRGAGGLVDVEFIAQFLQVVHGPALPPLRQANTEQALKALLKFKKLEPADGAVLLRAYQFLRHMENRVRVVHGLSAHQLPQKPEALRKLALRAGYGDTAERPAEAALLEEYRLCTKQVREIFARVVA